MSMLPTMELNSSQAEPDNDSRPKSHHPIKTIISGSSMAAPPREWHQLELQRQPDLILGRQIVFNILTSVATMAASFTSPETSVPTSINPLGPTPSPSATSPLSPASQAALNYEEAYHSKRKRNKKERHAVPTSTRSRNQEWKEKRKDDHDHLGKITALPRREQRTECFKGTTEYTYSRWYANSHNFNRDPGTGASKQHSDDEQLTKMRLPKMQLTKMKTE